ncbi:rod shape-determining protein MreC [Arcobacter vandammei]|uniref:rod shape-determining protein MreC n=1 Tax=Arcobacter vandammei TaxID=2782243 RepID=UPI0018E04422|nr:rod shape-determining protein MreC [Arcobacter vandammei]
MRKLIFVAFFTIAILAYIFKADEFIVKNFTFLNDVKTFYIKNVLSISNSLEKYFSQVKTIEELKLENQELRDYKILYNIAKEELEIKNEFLANLNLTQADEQVELVKVISYISFNDFTKVWLGKYLQSDKILGLISDNFAAGIVVNQENRAIGLLNGNKDCSYSVFIGNEKSPGIIMSSENEDSLQIKFIPILAEINEGDEVITSGMDNIFYEGLKVGVVTEVTALADMKIAKVKPYINASKKRYFYIYGNSQNSHNSLQKTN